MDVVSTLALFLSRLTLERPSAQPQQRPTRPKALDRVWRTVVLSQSVTSADVGEGAKRRSVCSVTAPSIRVAHGAVACTQRGV